MLIICPLSTKVSTKNKFIYNLNNYRNAHYFTLNKAKALFKVQITEQVLQLPKLDKIKIHYSYYAGSNRLTDTANVTSIVNKFFCDTLVELGKLPDDNYFHVLGTSDTFSGVDKNNPRVEAKITEINDEN